MIMTANNYRYIATEIGDRIKYNSTINEINRIASSTFNFSKDNFPNEFITSVRAKEVYSWIMTLARQQMSENERNDLLKIFCERLVPEDAAAIASVLEKYGMTILNPQLKDFASRGFHPEIHKHCKQLFLDKHYFHAVFEACKVYNKRFISKLFV